MKSVLCRRDSHCEVILLLSAAFALVIVTFSSSSAAQCAGPWQRLPALGGELIRPQSVILVAGAALPPLVLAPTGGDYALRELAQDELGGHYNAEMISSYTPYVVAGGTTAAYLSTWILGHCSAQRTTSAMLQGMVTTVVTVGFLKWVSGRQWPNGGRDPYAQGRLDDPDDATNFRPFQRGLNAAFPSGHTALMFAAAAAFRASTPQAGWWRFSGYPFAVAVAVGMWMSDHHWASDILSGAMLGEALGAASGSAFGGEEQSRVSGMIFPLPTGGAFVITGRL